MTTKRAINHGEKTHHATNKFHLECRGCTDDTHKIGQPVTLSGDDEIAHILLWRKCGNYLNYLGKQSLPVVPEQCTVESFLELANLLQALREAYSAFHEYAKKCQNYPISIDSY